MQPLRAVPLAQSVGCLAFRVRLGIDQPLKRLVVRIPLGAAWCKKLMTIKTTLVLSFFPFVFITKIKNINTFAHVNNDIVVKSWINGCPWSQVFLTYRQILSNCADDLCKNIRHAVLFFCYLSLDAPKWNKVYESIRVTTFNSSTVNAQR